MKLTPKALITLCLTWAGIAVAQSPYQSSVDFSKYAMKLREQSLMQLEPQVIIPTESNKAGVGGLYPWKLNIVATIFWVGESASANNPVHNFSSSWDKEWWRSYGGYDNPDRAARRGLPDGGTVPGNFNPQQNPFYYALPYNDVTSGHHKPEARFIPWFKQTFEENGKSVCHDRWIAIKKGNRVCYGQWSDCGPFRTDHFNYVFGPERPAPNLNQGAGLDVSPAMRDYLGLANTDVVDWKFVEFRDVPIGPWSRFGENNTFVIESRRSQTRVVQAEKRAPAVREPAKDGPVVVTQ